MTKLIEISLKFLLFKVLVLASFGINAQLKEHDQTLAFNLGSGGFIPHKSSVKHLLGGPAHKFELDYTFRTQGQKDFHQWYKYPYFGIVYAFETSGNPILIGNMHSINLFVGLPLYSGNNPLRFRMGAGLGYIQKIFDLQNNHKSNAIGSHINSNIQFRFEKDFQLLPSHILKLGIGFSHFSNGSYQKPNLGINFAHFYLGYGFQIKKHAPIEHKKVSKKITGENPFQFKVIAGFGIKENVTLLESKYFIGVLTGQLERKINHISSWILSSDNYINYSLQNNPKGIFQSGVSVGSMLHFDKVRLGFCVGSYLWNAPSEEETIYNKIMVEYHFSQKLFCQLLLKSHKATADFINLTLGMNIK
jgi:hypothetical protein